MIAQISYNGNRSTEKFEVNGAYMKISRQLRNDLEKGKPLDETIRRLVSKINGKGLFSKRLKTVCYSIGTMNRIVDNGDAHKMVSIAEALQQHGIELISRAIAARPQIKAVLIAGPSSSGKTTFSKKLSFALGEQGLDATCISFDDYYVNREDTPLDENGDYDYESLYAVNIDLFQEQFNTLLHGGEIEPPRYDFPTGKSVPSGHRFKLNDHTLLIMEGIHALNPHLVSSIPPENIFRIYISGLTVAKNDDGTYFPTTDNRLVRRLVRDAQFRATSASATLARWPSVRRGEEKWIVPFQKNADVNFCTAFQYELAILKQKALPLLAEVRPDEPTYTEAQRLTWVLDHFREIPVDLLPSHSLLREFLGGSTFKY